MNCRDLKTVMFWGASLKTKLISSLVVLILISSFCLYRLDHLNSIPTTPSNFSWINKAEIYVLGLAIGIIGYPIYPEVGTFAFPTFEISYLLYLKDHQGTSFSLQGCQDHRIVPYHLLFRHPYLIKPYRSNLHHLMIWK